MTDLFRRASPDEPFAMPAELYNGLLDMYRDWLRQRSVAKATSPSSPRAGRILFRNDSGSILDTHSIVGVGSELLSYTVDISPHKQGRYLPGVQIPIHAPDHIFETKPDYVLILPWNIKDEITERMAEIRQWGGQFVIAIPTLTILA